MYRIVNDDVPSRCTSPRTPACIGADASNDRSDRMQGSSEQVVSEQVENSHDSYCT